MNFPDETPQKRRVEKSWTPAITPLPFCAHCGCFFFGTHSLTYHKLGEYKRSESSFLCNIHHHSGNGWYGRTKSLYCIYSITGFQNVVVMLYYGLLHG